MIFTTYSGSTYEIKDGQVRRLNEGYAKRADGEWVTLANDPVVEIGEPVVMLLESLASRGTDDYGTPAWAADTHTTRVTSPVLSKEDNA